MRASDPVNRIMSEPVLTIGPNEPVKEVLRIFMAHPVHHLPVVDGRYVIGMLSSADVMKLQFFLPPSPTARNTLLETRWCVSKIMRTPVITIPEHETLQKAAELMALSGVHSLPVVDSDDRLVGLVTTTDVMRYLLAAEDDKNLQKPDEPTALPLSEHRVAGAVAAARRAVNTNHDAGGIASTLLQLQKRIAALEEVEVAAKRYLNAGQDERLHTTLAKAIERADRFDETNRRPAVLGLA